MNDNDRSTVTDDDLVRRLRADIEAMVGDAGQSLPPTAPTPSPRIDHGSPSHRWVAWGAAAATIAVLVGGLVVIANRGDDDAGDDVQADIPSATTQPHPDTAPPESMPPSTIAAGPAEYETLSSVIETDRGPQLCFVVMDSLPPQCGVGLALDGWSWDAIDVEQVNGGVTWVDSIYVRGTYRPDTGRFDVTEARIPTDEERERLTGGPALDFSVPCPEPDGGWPARNQEWPGDQIAAIPGYAGSWVDESQQVMTVKFTGDLAAAEAAVQQYYSDALCIVAGQHTEQELLAIQQQLMSMSSIQFLGAGVYVDATGEWVEADIAVPDPERQASFDSEFGQGVVRLSSPLHPITGDVPSPVVPPLSTPPQSTPPQSTPQAVTAGGTVFQHGDGPPALCLGALGESYPPTCTPEIGPELVGWSWDDIDHEVSASDVTWLESVFIRGEYDAVANTLTLIEQRAYNDDDAARFAAAFSLADYSTPCEPPAGGWPARNQEWPGEQIAAIDGYAGAWSESGGPMTVKFTGDLQAVEQRIEEFYTDPICLVAAEHTFNELTQVQTRLLDMSLAGWQTVDVIVDATGEWVDAVTLAPQPELQAELDAEFGPGLVRLRSMMLPVE